MYFDNFPRNTDVKPKVMKKFLTQTGQLGLPQKGQKQVADLQCNELTCTSLVCFVV